MLSNKNDYDNFEHLKLSIEKPRGQLLCYIQYVDYDKNILEPFCTKMHCDAIRLTGQSRYSICPLYGQGFHTYSTTFLPVLLQCIPIRI